MNKKANNKLSAKVVMMIAAAVAICASALYLACFCCWIDGLPYGRGVKYIDLHGKNLTFEMIMDIHNSLPNCKLDFDMTISGVTVSTDQTELNLSGVAVDVSELSDKLPFMYNLECVILKDSGLSNADLRALMSEYPGLRFDADFNVSGIVIGIADDSVDFTGIEPVDYEELRMILPFLYNMKIVHLECKDTAVLALVVEYPDVDFIYNGQVLVLDIPEDAVTYNGRSFKLYNIGTGWENVKAFCEEKGGYLASVHDKEENDFLYNYIKNQGQESAYIGLISDAEEDVWVWHGGNIEGECRIKRTINYTNQPDHEFNVEFYGMFLIWFRHGEWNDGPGPYGAGHSNVRTFICEWEAEDIDDVKAKGLLPDDTVRWEVNGNYYYIYKLHYMFWEAARKYCEDQGGHLATLTTPEENMFVYEYMRSLGMWDAYFGLYIPSHTTGGEWEWVTGEPFEYVNWYRKIKIESDFYVNWNYTKHVYKSALNHPNGTNKRQCLIFGEYDGAWANANFDEYADTKGYGTNFICAWDYAPRVE